MSDAEILLEAADALKACGDEIVLIEELGCDPSTFMARTQTAFRLRGASLGKRFQALVEGWDAVRIVEEMY
jgi:hypothetical protein